MNFFKISSIAYLWLHEEHNIAARSICSKCWNWKAKLHGDTELRGTYETLGPVSTEGLWELAKNERLWCLGQKVARLKLPFSVAATFPLDLWKSCRFLWGRIQRFQKIKHVSLIICYFTLMDAFYYNVGTSSNFQTVKTILNIFLYSVKQLI